jgi:GNAT superfamily N-acetyltransferase
MRDGEGNIVGGSHGWISLGWLHIDVLWLKQDIRRKGLGRQILGAIGGEAKRKGCRFSELDTLSFQALDFYLKCGYTIFGELDQLDGNHRRYFLKKTLNL